MNTKKQKISDQELTGWIRHLESMLTNQVS